MDINNISTITNEIFESTPESVVAVGYGKKMVDGKLTSELSIIYGVIEKKPLSEIPENERIPSTILIDGERVKTDVVEWEIPKLLQSCPPDFYDWISTPPPNRGLIRPLVGGVSITNHTKLSNYAGTMGFVAVDNQTNSLVGVSNAHVLIDDAFLDSDRTNNTIYTNVADNDVTQPSSGEVGYVGQNNKLGIVKRYYPITETGYNIVDCSIFTISETEVDTNTMYQQLGLTGWTQPMEFATQNEILNLVINDTPLYSSGRTTGAKGEGNMKLIPWAIAVSTNVAGNSKQGVPTTVTFQNSIVFVASGTTTPSGSICQYPIYAGDSGSALIGEFDGVRKIVGLNFAGSEYFAISNYITNVSTLMDISPYTGQTVNYSDIDNIQYHYVSGKSSDITLNLSGNTFWQVGLNDCGPQLTPTPTLTITPTYEPCSLIRNGSFEEFATCGGDCVGIYCAPPTEERFYPQGCVPYWTSLSSNGQIEVRKNGYLGNSYDGGYYIEVNANLAEAHALYQTISTIIGQDYRIEFAHSGRIGGFGNTMRVALSGTSINYFPTEYTGSTTTWDLHTIDFTATETQYNLIFSATTISAGGNYLDAVDVQIVGGPCAPVLTPTITITPTYSQTVTPTRTPTLTPTLTVTTTPIIEEGCYCYEFYIDEREFGDYGGPIVEYLDCTSTLQSVGFSGIGTFAGYCISSITDWYRFVGPKETDVAPIEFSTYTNTFNPCTVNGDCIVTGEPTPTPTPTYSQTVTPTITPTLSVTPTYSQTVTPTVTQTITITETPRSEVTPTITPTLSVTPTYSQTVTPTRTPTLTPTYSQTVTPTYSQTVTPTVTQTITITETPRSEVTPTPTVASETPCNCYTVQCINPEGCELLPYENCFGDMMTPLAIAGSTTVSICGNIINLEQPNLIITNTGKSCFFDGEIYSCLDCQCATINIDERDLGASDDGKVYVDLIKCDGTEIVNQYTSPGTYVVCVQVINNIYILKMGSQSAPLYSTATILPGSDCTVDNDCMA